MSTNDVIKKELQVIAHGQSVRFRLIKYAILIPLFGAIYWKFGFDTMLLTLGALAALGIIVHFFFRWKTKGWTQDWWLYMQKKQPE